MSKESLEQFMNQVAESEELQAKIGEEIDVDALIALGAECGCEISAEDLQESVELSEGELDQVAGGSSVASFGSSDQRVSVLVSDGGGGGLNMRVYGPVQPGQSAWCSQGMECTLAKTT
jgi:predicted ribosomally synthesized peptide with nif11-like leader